MTLYAVTFVKYDKFEDKFTQVEPEVCATQEEAVKLANNIINDEVSHHLDSDPKDTCGYNAAISHIKHMTGICYGRYRRDSYYNDGVMAMQASIQETEV